MQRHSTSWVLSLIVVLLCQIEVYPQTQPAGVSGARQILEDFYQQHPPRPSEVILQEQERTMSRWAQQELPKMAPDLAKSVSRLGQTGESSGRAHDPVTSVTSGTLTPKELESLSRDIADSTRRLVGGAVSDRPANSASQDTSQPSPVRPAAEAPGQQAGALQGTPDETGPLKFLIPEGWFVDHRDPKGIRLHKNGGGDRTFIGLFRHPGFGQRYAYTPEGVSQGVISFGGFQNFPHGRQAVTVGKDARPAIWVWSSRSDVGWTMEHTYLLASGGVYMIHTGYSPADADTKKAYDHVLQSLRFTDGLAQSLEVEPQASPASAGNSSTGDREREASPADAAAGRPTKEEVEQVTQNVSKQLSQFLAHQGAARVAQKAETAIRRAEQWSHLPQKQEEYKEYQCLQFVREVYGFAPIGLPSAQTAQDFFARHGALNTTPWKNAPRGSWLFFSYHNQKLGNVGHVAISLGSDQLIDARTGSSPTIDSRPISADKWYATPGRFQGWVNPADLMRYYER